MAMRKYGRAGKIWIDDDLLEVASRTFFRIDFLADATAGDYVQLVVPFDCKVISGDFMQDADEGGTAGVINVEAWDVVAGTSQRDLFSAYTIDGAAITFEALTLSSTEEDLYLVEGEIINLLVTTAASNGVGCFITVGVETLELVKY